MTEISSSDVAIMEVASCCDAIVGAFNARLDRAQREQVRKAAAATSRAIKSGKSADKIADIERETERFCAAVAKTQGHAVACLVDDARRSIELCIVFFSSIVDGVTNDTDFETAKLEAADAVLPLVRQLKSLIHISRAYPQESRKRATRLRSAALANIAA